MIKKTLLKSLSGFGRLSLKDAEDTIRELWIDNPYAAKRLVEALTKIAEESINGVP